jgi:hypothetical protein
VRGRGLLTWLSVAALALTGAHAGLGGIKSAGEPVAVATAKPLFAGVSITPGESVVRTARVGNAGDAAGHFVLSATAAGELARELRLEVSDRSGRIVYRGSLLGLEVATLGVLAPGQVEDVRIAVGLPAGASNHVAGGVAEASFAWSTTRA